MEKIQEQLKEINKEMEHNKEVFNEERLTVRNVITHQNNYFKKQELLRAKIEKCERQETLYQDLKELGIIK